MCDGGKFYSMFVRGSIQLRQLLTAVDVVRATFTVSRILEELASELKFSGQEVQNALSHLAADRADKLSRGGNAPPPVVSVNCSSLGLYALWWYSRATSRFQFRYQMRMRWNMLPLVIAFLHTTVQCC